MDNVARFVSLDFHSAEAKIEFRKRQLEFQRNMEEIELVISVDTADDSMISIFVFPEESALTNTEAMPNRLAKITNAGRVFLTGSAAHSP